LPLARANPLRSLAPFDDDSPDSDYAYPELDHLYLIQNKLAKIEGVAHRLNLVYLELGGNRIRTIENLPISANLKSLFLGKNKITKIEGLKGLTGLRTLSIQSKPFYTLVGWRSLRM
jgi:protein phosphatase 1 regulatory subunit 7